jgi:hypothetical protein
MTLDILENSNSIELADLDFLNLLFKHSINFGKGKVIYDYYNGSKLQNFTKETDIYSLKEKNIWFSYIQENNRFFYAFGSGSINNINSNTPFCVIDFPTNGVNRNCLGAFAITDNSDIFVLISSNYNKLRERKSLLIISERIQAIETNNKKYFINLGQLNHPNFLNNFIKFLNEMGNIKFSNSESTPKVHGINMEDKTQKSCVLCSKKFSKIDLKYNSYLNTLIKENPDKCFDCLEKIYAAKALNEIKGIIGLSFFNENTLLDRVDNKVLFESYLQILEKLDIIKNRKFGNNKDFYMFNQKIDLDEFINNYSNIVEGSNRKDNISGDVSNKSINNKICKVCGVDLDIKNFYKSDSSKDGYSVKCKGCIRKSYATNALKTMLDYIEPDTFFKKEDLLKQVPNRMQFLDYIWTLQELNLLTQVEQTDSYKLKRENELNKFIERYSDKNLEILDSPKPDVVKKVIKVIKTCETCSKKLPISTFYKSTTTEDGYSNKCKECSRKSHAAIALSELMKCVEPGILFFKEDLLNQCENRMQFLDYLWTLQELDLLKNDEDSDAYILKSEKELDEFIDKYGKPKETLELDDNISEVSMSNNKTLELDLMKDKTSKVTISDDEVLTTTNSLNNNIKKPVKSCAVCGQKLPLSNFYKSSSNEDGHVEKCKKCSDKINATKILNEIQKYIEIGKPFTQNELSKKIGNPTKAKYYLWTLLEQDLIKYQEKTETYILELDNLKDDKHFQQEKPKELSSETSSINHEKTSFTTPSEIYNGIQMDNEDNKEIIYISNNTGSMYTNIMMKAIVTNENILPTLWGIETIMLSNMKKLLITRNLTNFSEIIIDLEIKNESLNKILGILEDENWNNITYNK